MRKFASLAVVLMLVLCLATTAFAAEPQVFDVYSATDMPTEITLAAGEEATINMQAYQLDGKTLQVTGDNAVITVTNMMGSVSDGPDSVVEGVMQNIMGCTVTVKNAGTESATYALEVVIPLGELGNPDTLVMGENVANIAEGCQGYFYTWTAPAAGQLTVTMPTGNWFYCVNNMTTTVYGDNRWSDDEVVVNPTVIDVAEGDEIQVIVNNYDPNSWMAPAGELSFGALFNCAEHAAEKVDAVASTCHSNGVIEHWYCAACNGYWTNAELTQVTNAKNIVDSADGIEGVEVEHVEAVEVGCHNNGNQEHWVCGGCNGIFMDAECTQETIEQRVILPATGMTTATHVPASEPYCHRNGVQEHWICDDCGGYFSDAECTQQVMQPKQLIIPAEVTLEYHEKVNATCVENGMEEYWYCAECDCYFTDAEGIFNVASKRLVIEADGKSHDLEHHEAADPVCHRNGNVEYWYCADCDCYFTEAEGNLVNSNAKNIVILAENELEHHEAVAATCTKDGMAEYWYCDDCDCYFTDAEGIFNIASKRLVVPAAGHTYDANGDCTVCGDNPKTSDMGILTPVVTLLASAMSTVALVIKKKEF